MRDKRSVGENEITFAIWLLFFCCVNKSDTVSRALSKKVLSVPGKLKTTNKQNFQTKKQISKNQTPQNIKNSLQR